MGSIAGSLAENPNAAVGSISVDLPPSSGPSRKWVGMAAGVAALLVSALLPIANHPGPPTPGLVVLFATGIFITELSTSFLLLVRFLAVRTWSLLVLACAYFYSGLMPLPHVLTFPGAVLRSQPFLNASLQSTSWIYLLWISGFALTSLAAVILRAVLGERRIKTGRSGPLIAIGLFLMTIVAIAVVYVAIWTPDRLPPLVNGTSFTTLNSEASWFALVLLVASVAVVLLTIGERDRLFLWLALALIPMVAANMLSTAGGGHFTVGWMIGRLSWLTSACVLFVYLMLLHARDQHLWARTRDLLDGSNQGAVALPENRATSAVDAALKRFVLNENVIRYERMLEQPHDQAKREVLLQLLSEEKARLNEFERARSPKPS